MNRTRTEKTIMNLAWAVPCQLVLFTLEFFMRREFASALGEVCLGVESTFESVLMLVSATNLGIVPAMAYSLFKPIARQDQEKLLAVVQFLHRACWVLGVVFGVLGVAFLPHLNLLFNNPGVVPQIKLIYLVFLASTILPYFFASRTWLLLNSQRKYIVVLISAVCTSLGILGKLFFLKTRKSFVMFAFCMLGATLLEGVATVIVSGRVFPILKQKASESLKKAEIKQIFKNAKGGAMNQVFGIVIHVTNSAYISKIAGLAMAGAYAPYKIMLNAFKTVNKHFYETISAGFGDLAASGDGDKLLARFYDILFVSNWFFGMVVCNMAVNLTPLVGLWMPKNHTLGGAELTIILANFYLMCMHKIIKTVRDSMGIYYQARYVTLYEAAINLFASYFGAKHFGIAGVLGGTSLSLLLTCFWCEPYLIYKHGFKVSPLTYFRKQLGYYLLTLLCCAICIWLCGGASSWLGLVKNSVITAVVHSLSFFLVFKNSEEFLFFKALVVKELAKLTRRAK